jgi:hypothetical protein
MIKNQIAQDIVSASGATFTQEPGAAAGLYGSIAHPNFKTANDLHMKLSIRGHICGTIAAENGKYYFPVAVTE